MNTEMARPFTHRQYAHCESGVSSNLIQHSGLALSEAMAFGIGSGIFFAHMPFVKIMGIPLTSYRSMPTTIFKKCCKRLGLDYKHEKFSQAEKGQARLDTLLAEKKIVALQTNIYWLPYIPERFRFPFNAHNIIVFGNTPTDGYQVSDPILESTSLCPPEAMAKARFAKGPLAPKGFLYYIDRTDVTLTKEQFQQAIYLGLKESVHRMLYTPLPFFGVRAIRYLAKKIRHWHRDNEARRFTLLLTNVVRMQEEIGTGGAGFRFLFAKFLEESSTYYPDSDMGMALKSASQEFLMIGDRWRQWATQAVRICKSRDSIATEQVEALAKLLEDIYLAEVAAFQNLHKNFILKAKA